MSRRVFLSLPLSSDGLYSTQSKDAMPLFITAAKICLVSETPNPFGMTYPVEENDLPSITSTSKLR